MRHKGHVQLRESFASKKNIAAEGGFASSESVKGIEPETWREISLRSRWDREQARGGPRGRSRIQ